ncbi:MAG: DUF1540 domain-containing protein [Clostridia bacterium]|nr:DUF1540 domain-containing protein [Clostridia bacterium]MBR5768538.1 DUF1540 domain-containing protein [Clostridia bacterium]
MNNLRCGVKTCVNNSDYCCCLPKIDVAGKTARNCGETCCVSFGERRMHGRNSVNSFDAELATDVGCDAINCVHNENGGCTAVTVNIAGRKAMKCYDTECDSFRMRR